MKSFLGFKGRMSTKHGKQHAADGPDVDVLAVLRVAGEELRPSVPARSDTVVVLRIVSYEVDDAPAEPA